ncbi:unnamed protein product [Mycena citricolor]|uniref:Uncharacterized protein n=1 Tax=Mycena citricolor TaxID=2018698 RepID=A0AAD2Q0K0_9AGAR|nr:unnamed protein product [Mycena citricolor]
MHFVRSALSIRPTCVQLILITAPSWESFDACSEFRTEGKLFQMRHPSAQKRGHSSRHIKTVITPHSPVYFTLLQSALVMDSFTSAQLNDRRRRTPLACTNCRQRKVKVRSESWPLEPPSGIVISSHLCSAKPEEEKICRASRATVAFPRASSASFTRSRKAAVTPRPRRLRL